MNKIEIVEREIDSRFIRRTCQGIVTAAKYLSDHCGPAPAGWPGTPDGDENMLLDDSVIEEIKAQVAALERDAEAEAGRKNKEQQQKREAQQIQAPWKTKQTWVVKRNATPLS